MSDDGAAYDEEIDDEEIDDDVDLDDPENDVEVSKTSSMVDDDG